MSDTSVDLGPEEPADLGDEEPVHGDNLGIASRGKPEVPHEDPAIVEELRARADAHAAGVKPPARSASLAAFRVANSDLTSDQGAEALQRADSTGLGPVYVAKNLDAVRAADNSNTLKTTLQQAPVLASYMAQSPAHAAALADDADPHSFIEWFFGKWNRAEPAEAVGPYAEDQRLRFGTFTPGQEREIVPGSWEQFVAKGLLSLKAAYIGAKEALRPQFGPDGEQIEAPEGEESELRATQELAAAPVAGTEGSLPREMIGASIEAVPQLVGFTAASAPFLFAQTMGQLHNHFSLAKNDDGTRRFTESQARGLSLSGAAATTVVLDGLAKKMGQSVFGKYLSKEAQAGTAEAAANGIAEKLIASSSLFENLMGRGVQFKDAMLHGIGFMVGQSVINDLTEQAGDVLTGGKFDSSKTVQATKQSVEGAFMLLPLMALGPVREAVGDVGRAVRGHADAVDFASSVEAAKASKFIKNAPEQAKQLLDAQAAQDPSRATAFVPVDAFDRAMREAEQDPAEVAGAMQDGGAAYQEAKATGGDVALPMSEVLTKLAPAGLADGLVLDAKFDPEGMTAREAQRWQEAWHGTPHQMAEFDLSKIGTGEGNQSFGYGGYFAEAKAVADSYRPLPERLLREHALEAFKAGKPISYDVRQDGGAWRVFEKIGDREWSIANYGTQAAAEAHAAEERGRVEIAKSGGGHLYRFEIPAKEDLLDYDKSLSEQPEIVKKLRAAKLLPEYEVREGASGAADTEPGRPWQAVEVVNDGRLVVGHYETEADATERANQDEQLSLVSGKYLYGRLGAKADVLEPGKGDLAASEALRDAGIPGLQYLDQGSRDAAAGTHNFVIWDQSRIRMATPGAGMRESMSPEAARAFYDALPADEQIGVKMPIAADLTPEQAAKLEQKETTPRAATPETVVARPNRGQPPALVAAGERSKEARDLDAALSAYAANRIAELPIGQIRPSAYEHQARQATFKAQNLARTVESGIAGDDNAKIASAAAEQTISEVQTQQRVAEHLAKAAEKAKTAAGKIADYLNERAGDEKRVLLAKAGQPFLDASDAILGALGFRDPAPAASVDGVVQAVGAQDIGFDPDALKAILAKGSFSNLTLDEAKAARDALKTIRSAANRETQVQIAGRKQAVRDVVDGVKDTLASRAPGGGGGDEGISAASGALNPPGPKGVLAKGKAILTEMLQPQELMRRVGLNEMYQRNFVDARNHREDLFSKIGDYFYKHYELAMPDEMKARKLEIVDGWGGKLPGRVTRQDVWELASWSGSESSAYRAAKGLGISEEQLYQYLDRTMTKPEWDFVQSRWDFSDKEVWPLLSDHLAEKTGLPPPKIEARAVQTQFGEYRGGYNPARYRFDLGREQGAGVPEGVADAWGNLRKGMPATASYFTKPRVQKYFDVPDLRWSAFSGHLQSVAHYLAFDNFVGNLGRVLRDQEFRQTVRNADGLGEPALQQLDEFLRTTARGTVEQAATGALQTTNLFGGGLVRSRVGTAAFQLNLRVVAGQLSHILFAMPQLGAVNVTSGLLSALNPFSYGDAFSNSRQLPYRWNDYGAKTREMLGGIGPEERSGSRKWVDTAGWSLYHWMDGFLSKVIWEAAKQKSLSEQAKLPAGQRTIEVGDGPKPEHLAADEWVSRLMPPRNIMEQSSFARDRGVVGSMLLVRNFPNTIYNVSAMRAWDLGTDARAAAPGWSKAKTYAGGGAAMAGALMASYLGVHLVGQYLMGHGKEEDETYQQWLTRQALLAPLYQFGPAEDAADPFIRSLVHGKSLKYEIVHGHAGLQNAPAIEFFNQGIRDIASVADDHGEKRAFAGLRLVSRLAGGPTALIPSLQYGYDLAKGTANPSGPFGLAAGFMYGKHPHQAKNIFTDSGAKP